MPRNDRSPLHPSALRLRDMTPGREIVVFNLNHGVVDFGYVVGYPYSVEVGENGRVYRWLEVDIRSLCYDHFNQLPLCDIGVMPDALGWNMVNFTIPASRVHLLPQAPAQPNHRRLWGARQIEFA